jgi:hypothetical protein
LLLLFKKCVDLQLDYCTTPGSREAKLLCAARDRFWAKSRIRRCLANATGVDNAQEIMSDFLQPRRLRQGGDGSGLFPDFARLCSVATCNDRSTFYGDRVHMNPIWLGQLVSQIAQLGGPTLKTEGGTDLGKVIDGLFGDSGLRAGHLRPNCPSCGRTECSFGLILCAERDEPGTKCSPDVICFTREQADWVVHFTDSRDYILAGVICHSPVGVGHYVAFTLGSGGPGWWFVDDLVGKGVECGPPVSTNNLPPLRTENDPKMSDPRGFNACLYYYIKRSNVEDINLLSR